MKHALDVMRPLAICAPLLAVALGGELCADPGGMPTADATGPNRQQTKHRRLRIIPIDDWNANHRDVEKVLQWTARETWQYFPDRELPPLIVQPKGGPIVLFQRGDRGELQVRLNTGDTYWAQYAYQFSHEFCHILCNYDDDPQRNKWFEESLCETASIFTLRRMAETWKTDPPYPHWKDFAGALKKYSDGLLEKDPLPEDIRFVDWYAEHRDHLYANGTDRAQNRIVARHLLPLFEEQPRQWSAVSHLNTEQLTKEHSFQDYLSAWHRHCPKVNRAFVRQIAVQFGIQIR